MYLVAVLLFIGISLAYDPPTFRCKYRDGRININQVCDGIAQCPDGSDEAPSFCKVLGNMALVRRTRQSPYFLCDNRWVHNAYWCDGIRHCADGTDEDPRNCRRPSYNHFGCAAGNPCPCDHAKGIVAPGCQNHNRFAGSPPGK